MPDATPVTAPTDTQLSPALFDFLFDLDVNNQRAWFDANRARFEAEVREPVLALIRGLEGPVHRRVSKRLVVSDARQGGSMFRIHRDTRFSNDPRPYKTNVGFQFRHEAGRDVHAPGVYVHLEPGNCFMGAGIYRPDTATLTRIRDAIVGASGPFRRMRSRVETGGWRFGGESLARGPRGYDRDHPLFDELCRTSWILVHDLTEEEATSPGFGGLIVERSVQARPLMAWLCRTLDLPW